MSDAAETIRRAAGERPLSSERLLTIMVNLRKVLEQSGKKSDYPILNLYCNWCVHSELSGSVVLWEALRELTDILVRHEAVSNPVVHEINDRVIAVPTLQKQMVSVLRELDAPFARFREKRSWFSIFQGIAELVIGSPLRFPEGKTLAMNKKAQAIHEDARRIAGDTDLLVTQFRLLREETVAEESHQVLYVGPPGAPMSPPQKGSKRLFWSVQAQQEYVSITSPVILR